MRSISFLTLALLAGCASLKTYPAPAQTYRAPGQDHAATITGRFDVSGNPLYIDAAALHVLFDGVEVLRGNVDLHGNGEVSGGQWNGLPVSSSCHGTPQGRLTQVDCIVFVGNERTVTLTF